MTLRQTLYVGDDCLHHCGLGFGQCGSHHNTRVLRVYAVSVFRPSPVFPTGCGPLRLSPSGQLGDPEVCSSVPPSSVRRIRLSVMWRTVRAIQLSPYRAGLAGRPGTRLPVPPAFPTGSCPLWLSPSGQSMTQESPFALLLTASRMQYCVPRRTVSLHPAQASRRPCDGPVSSHTTCWLYDTAPKSMPLRGREHQWNKATAICHTFSIDSSVVLVPRHRREVCPLARRVMWPRPRAQPVSTPLQGGLRFFPPLYPHCRWLA